MSDSERGRRVVERLPVGCSDLPALKNFEFQRKKIICGKVAEAASSAGLTWIGMRGFSYPRRLSLNRRGLDVQARLGRRIRLNLNHSILLNTQDYVGILELLSNTAAMSTRPSLLNNHKHNTYHNFQSQRI